MGKAHSPYQLPRLGTKREDTSSFLSARAQHGKQQLQKHKTNKPLRFGTWNVRTMCPGLVNLDPTKTKDIRKTAVIDRELERLQVDIAALQETRLPDCGSVKEKNYTFFWQDIEPV
uniref:Endonuclease/exonuclease/phosphatase domain-containing protein n=1 Tax=Arion vulgaris TaxID=1028688 RepID=A0A0B7BU24_9EUPU